MVEMAFNPVNSGCIKVGIAIEAAFAATTGVLSYL